MATRWRELLDAIGVTWTDQGRNTARGWISIACCWCHDDPSAHLGINEAHGHYRCLRNPEHKGRSPYWLLKGLGVKPRDIDDLLDAYGSSNHQAESQERSVAPARPVFTHRWDSFVAAASDPEALDYLYRRHFPDPERTVKEFDLRTGSGKWGRRLWLALRDLGGSVTGFTGRALDSWRSPRYYTEAPEPVLYLPKPPAAGHRLVLLVEGPMDALRTADVVTHRRRNHVLPIALGGLSVTGSRRLQLSQLARMVPSFAFACDAGVPEHTATRLMAELRAIPRLGRITRLRMTPGIDDPGAMTDNQIEEWLSTL